jgi:hypothetical protein
MKTTLTTKLLSLAAASMILTASANAGGSFMSLGYANASVKGTSSSGASLDLGVKFGEKYKQKIATKYIFVGKNSNLSDGTGNILDFYYSLGYEVLPRTTLSAKIGYGFMDIGSIGTGRNRLTVYADGLVYGVEAAYDLGKYFDVTLSYEKQAFSYSGISYDTDVIGGALLWKF